MEWDLNAADWETRIFRPTDAFDLYAGQVIRSQSLTAVTLTIVVQYRPFGIPFERERVFRFTTQLGPDNKLHWMQRPAN